MLRLVLLCLSLSLSGTVFAAIDAYPFPNDEMRERYNALIDELRCPQCLNTNLAGSDSMIAKDLRREVHRLVLEGKSDDEILTFMHQRYGDFILYKPRLNPATYALWFGPLAILLLTIFIGFKVIRARAISAEISAEEQARLDTLIIGDVPNGEAPNGEVQDSTK